MSTRFTTARGRTVDPVHAWFEEKTSRERIRTILAETHEDETAAAITHHGHPSDLARAGDAVAPV